MRIPPFEFDTIRQSMQTQDTSTRRQKVSSVIVGMETDEITLKNTEEDFSSDREDSVMQNEE